MWDNQKLGPIMEDGHSLACFCVNYSNLLMEETIRKKTEQEVLQSSPKNSNSVLHLIRPGQNMPHDTKCSAQSTMKQQKGII